MATTAETACKRPPESSPRSPEDRAVKNARRELDSHQISVAAQNGAGVWGRNCFGSDCTYCCDSSAEDIRNTGYILECAHCKSPRCASCLTECDACGDFVCHDCTHEIKRESDVAGCRCARLIAPGEDAGILCPKHWRSCSDSCEEIFCLCAFRGKSHTCRECE